jgi:serine/threonine protein kinase/Tol biopolymer transport system component
LAPEDVMAAQAERTLRPEDEISHYRIVSPLAKGGMGEVYLAQDRKLERRVALKILPPDLVKSEDRVRRFGLEAKSASSLNHPNIVTIYEIGHDIVRSPGAPDSDPVHYISMELVSGKTLAALIHDDKRDLRTLIGYLAQAAEGLAKAHAAGIVHRDLKPGNIMVSADGFAKVLDFGLAKLTERREGGPDITEDPTLARDGSAAFSVVGTAGYMSPEQVQGRAVDHRSDIFAFGCILYEAATRRKPFAAETGIETMHKVLNEKPVPVEELNAEVPAELRRLVKRCLAKSPDQRVQSIKDLAIELREIAEEYDTLSAGASSTSHASGTAGAARAARTLSPKLLAGAALVAVAGLALGWWGLGRPTRDAQAPAAFQSMRMSTQTSRGDVIECALSSDGRYLAYLAGRTGRNSLRVRQVATGSDVEVVPTRDGLEAPAFSPDGNYLFFSARRPDNPTYRALYQVPSLGGTPRERAFDVDSRVAFSSDGKQVAFWRQSIAEREGRLVVLDLDASRERLLAKVNDPEGARGAPAWSPDDTTLAATLLRPAPDLQTTVAFYDATSGARRDHLALPWTILQSLAWLGDGRGLVAAGQDLRRSINEQVFLIHHPQPRLERVTNDFYRYFGVSVAGGEEAIAATRLTRLANLWLADAGGGEARPLTSTTNPEDSPFDVTAVGADTIVFDAPRDQAIQLWALAAGGGEPRALTSGQGISVNPRAAGGGVVLFDQLDDAGVHVFRVGTDGSDLRQLTSGAGEQVAAVSPDGRFAAFAPYDDTRNVRLIALQDGSVKPFAADVAAILAFSPDSTRLLLGQPEPDAQGLTRVVWKAFPVAGGPPSATFRLPPTAIDPAWTPDGRALSFRNRADAAWNVYRQAEDAKAPVQVTRFGDGRLTAHAWSPDGKRLALAHRTDEGGNVWVTGADGSRPVQVTRLSAADVFRVAWLPDSRRLAISAGKLSRDAVLIRSFR